MKRIIIRKEEELEIEDSVIFNSKSAKYVKDPEYIAKFIEAQEEYFNGLFKFRGSYVSLNEVLDGFGIEHIPHGQLVGWLNQKKIIFECEALDNCEIRITFNIEPIYGELL